MFISKRLFTNGPRRRHRRTAAAAGAAAAGGSADTLRRPEAVRRRRRTSAVEKEQHTKKRVSTVKISQTQHQQQQQQQQQQQHGTGRRYIRDPKWNTIDARCVSKNNAKNDSTLNTLKIKLFFKNSVHETETRAIHYNKNNHSSKTVKYLSPIGIKSIQ